MTTFQKFKKALVEMKHQGELERILKASKLKDKAAVKHDIELINQLADLGSENVSAIPVIYELKSVDVFKNALCYMVKYDEKES